MAGRKKTKVVTDPEEIMEGQEVREAEAVPENTSQEASSDSVTPDAPADPAPAEDAVKSVPADDIADPADAEEVFCAAEDASEDFLQKGQDLSEGTMEEAADPTQEAADTAEDAAADGLFSEKAAEESRKRAAERAEAAKKKAADIRNSIRNWVPGPQLPNQLTIARVCMIPVFVALLLWMKKPAGNILAMIVFILASLTDAADGYIARRYNYISTFGKFMDPLADKLLVCSALICLVDLGRIESWIVIIIIAREFIISGFRLVAVEKGVVIAANFWGKFKTVFQMLMVILMVANFGGFFNLVAQILKWIALALTLISLVTYLVKNREVLKDIH